jgi:hypothetical protein
MGLTIIFEPAKHRQISGVGIHLTPGRKKGRGINIHKLLHQCDPEASIRIGPSLYPTPSSCNVPERIPAAIVRARMPSPTRSANCLFAPIAVRCPYSGPHLAKVTDLAKPGSCHAGGPPSFAHSHSPLRALRINGGRSGDCILPRIAYSPCR